MNGRALSALALVAAFAIAETTFIIGAGTAATGATLGIGIGAGGAVAAAAAVGGALALGALGAAAILGGRRGRHGRRGRREVVSCLPFSNPELYFSMAANSDFQDCGRRFVCELEAANEASLSEEELLIRDIFGAPSTATNGSAGTFFREAGQLGASEGETSCALAFSTCPFDRKAIFKAFQIARQGV